MTIRTVLALDGGGIRGVVSALWLAELERRLRSAGKGGIRDHFDLIAGTSTGAILGCGIASGITPQQLVDLYVQRRHEIFPGGASRLWSRASRFFTQGPSAPKYDGKGLREVVSSTLGETAFKHLTPRTLVVSYDTITRSTVIFKSHKQEHWDLRVRDVCVASASAPTYFPGHIMEVEGKTCALIDGGVVANNPTACAIAEALRINREAGGADQELTVVSLGTGEATRPIPAAATQEWGPMEWALPIIDVLFDGATKAVDYIARQTIGAGYFRLQTRLTKGMDDMDDVSATNVNALMEVARDYLREPQTDQMLSAVVARL